MVLWRRVHRLHELHERLSGGWYLLLRLRLPWNRGTPKHSVCVSPHLHIHIFYPEHVHRLPGEQVWMLFRRGHGYGDEQQNAKQCCTAPAGTFKPNMLLMHAKINWKEIKKYFRSFKYKRQNTFASKSMQFDWEEVWVEVIVSNLKCRICKHITSINN